jgi:signal transduction histidine kinase/ActR/RegA family two-component response regulator
MRVTAASFFNGHEHARGPLECALEGARRQTQGAYHGVGMDPADLDRFHQVALATRDAVYDWDVRAGTVWRNEAYQTLYSPNEPVGTDEAWWEEHIHPDDRTRVLASIGGVFSLRKRFWSDAYRFRRHDGAYADVMDRGYVTYDDAGAPLRMIGAITDVTQVKHAEADRAARVAAEAANAAKSAFLASMSHELRTPLNAILGYAQLLQHHAVDERVRRGLATIEQSGQHLLALINDLLDVARIEAGRLELCEEPIDVAVFLGSVADAVRVKAERKGLAFTLDAAPGLPRCVRSDERRLRQVLLNLLGNAVKFTDRGSVTLMVGATPGRLRFEVRDTGVGIDAADLPRLFEPFSQAGDPRRRAGGSGLGLAISRGLARALGGDIEVTSTPGVGSVFAFEIRALAAAAAAPPPAPCAVTGYAGARRRVLVVDDDADGRRLVADLLRPLGFDVAEACDGAAGLQAARARPPDLILMDNVMPVLDGVQATRRLREDPALRAVPVIAVSASAARVDREQCLGAGADAFLDKPVDVAALLRLIGELLQLQWNGRDASASE